MKVEEYFDSIHKIKINKGTTFKLPIYFVGTKYFQKNQTGTA